MGEGLSLSGRGPPLGVGEADDAAAVGHALRRVHERRALLVLQLRQLAERLHRRHQAVQDAAALGVLARVGRPHGCQRRHELEEEVSKRIVRKQQRAGRRLTTVRSQESTVLTCCHEDDAIERYTVEKEGKLRSK